MYQDWGFNLPDCRFLEFRFVGMSVDFPEWPAFDMSLWDVFEPWYGQLSGDEFLMIKSALGDFDWLIPDWYR